jgi:Metallo-peptidase family M12/Dockerin type I domain
MKILFRNGCTATFLALFLCAYCNLSVAQTSNLLCGTPPPTVTERQALKALINAPTPRSTFTSTTIPIHFWIFRKDNDAASTSLAAIDETLAGVNQRFHFPNNEQFIRCKTDYILDARFAEMRIFDSTVLKILFATTYFDNNAINIYIVTPLEGVGGVGYSPLYTSYAPNNNAIFLNNIIFKNSTIKERKEGISIFAHELGHYFGLSHTHDQVGGGISDRETVARSGIQSNCDEKGDLLCDTPADYKTSPGITDCYNNPNCVGGVCNFTDIYGATLTPDYTNIMSYFNYDCLDHFSLGQQTSVMDKALYTYLNRKFLLNTNTCPTPFASYGTMISRACIEGNAEGFIAPKNYSVNILTQPSNNNYPLAVTNSYNFYSPPLTDNSTVTITPSKNSDFTNGVTTFDISLISKHILDIQPFNSSWTKIAADVNYDGEIDGADMLFIRNLILRKTDRFPNNVGSWRFIPEYYFATSASFKSNFQIYGPTSDPFALTYSNGAITKTYLSTNGNSYLDVINLDNATIDGKKPSSWSFHPIKMGNVNCVQDNNSLRMASASSRYQMNTNISTNQIKNQRNLTLALKAQYSGEVSSFQVGIKLAPTKLQLKKVLKGDLKTASDEFDSDITTNGEVRALWYNNKGKNRNFTEGVTLMKLKVKSMSDIQDILNELKLDDALLQNNFYDENGNTASVKLSLEIDNDSNDDVQENPYTVKTYPNPFNSELTFEIKAPKNEAAVITIYNAFGRALSVTKKDLVEGTNLINITGGNSFPMGSLSYTIQTPTQLLNGYLTKAR